MLIPNLATFTGIDPATNPGIKHGNLDPITQFASADLLDMAVGSLYLQKMVALGGNCTTLGISACLWIKVDRSQDTCNVLGSAKDWRRCCCFGLLEGPGLPAATEDPWCSAQTGDWYLQDDTLGCTVLWLKIRDSCGSGDWFNVTGTRCLTAGDTPPDPATLCTMDIGATYVDTSTTCPTLYIKIADLCDANDWLNLADGCVLDRAGTPVGAIIASLCELPIGAYVRDTTDSNRLYVKTKDLCLGNDFQPIQMKSSAVYACPPDITLNIATQVLNLPPRVIGNRRRASVTHGLFPLPANTLTVITGPFDDIRIAQPASIAPVAPSNALIAPCDGYYRIGIQCGTYVNTASGIINGAGSAVNGALVFMEYFPSPTPAAGVVSQCFLSRDVNLNAGDIITAIGYTQEPLGCDTGSWHVILEYLAPRGTLAATV